MSAIIGMIYINNKEGRKQMLTKKHFKKIAEIIGNNRSSNFSNPLSQKIDLVDKLSNLFLELNKNFDREKFTEACLKELKFK
jgi:hypothetical protein|tara:strand:- start:2572 stop:2817 length:246 start_codon:yes stop_codon:yes gene_type:complete